MMITQFKTLDDIAELIKEYETALMRPTLKLSHPTLYRKRDAGKGKGDGFINGYSAEVTK